MTEDEPRISQHAQLYIIGEDLEPSEVSKALGLTPSHSWRKGEQVSAILPDGRQHTCDSVHDNGGWRLCLDEEHRNKELFIQFLDWASLLRPKVAELQDLRERGAVIELSCYLSTDSAVTLEVDHVLLAEFGNLGIDLCIDFFCGP